MCGGDEGPESRGPLVEHTESSGDGPSRVELMDAKVDGGLRGYMLSILDCCANQVALGR